MPNASAYLIIQLSDDEQFIYCGLMTIKDGRRVGYFLSKMALAQENRQALFKMVATLAQNKMTMQKAPITIEEDLINLENDSNEEINKLIEQVEAFFKPISDQINPILNPKIDGDTEDGLTNNTGSKKKDEKKPPAKAPPAKGKADGNLAAFESPLPLPTSGIESLVLLVDRKIESLPLETLKMFEQIPVVSRDFNLHMYMQRLSSIGHQAELHNNKGIEKNSMSYIIDPPAPLNEQAVQLAEQELPGMLTGSQWNGTLTSTKHIPSEGEW